MDRSWLPTAAGILEILAGVTALLGALALIVAGTVTTVVPAMTSEPQDDLPLALVSGVLWSLALFGLVAGLVAVAGGIAALRRGGWRWPLAGAIGACFSALPLGVLALIFVAAAEPELRGGPRGPEPPAA